MLDRREDPRDDAQFSLRNLLSVRALRERFALAVLGTTDGMLMVGSQEDRAAQRVAAHVSAELRSGPGRFVRSGTRGVSLSGLHFQAGGRSLCLAVLQPGSGVSNASLDSMAARVRAILAGD